MRCADAGLIQAYLDGECSAEESEKFREHVKECAPCRLKLEELFALEAWTANTLEKELFRPADKIKVDTEAAWQAFSRKIGQSEGTGGSTPLVTRNQVRKRSWKDMNKKTKNWVVGASAAAVLVVSLSFPQVQAAANDFLSIFRMDKVEFVKVTPEDLREVEAWMSSGRAGEMELKGIGKLWIDESGQKVKEHRSYNSREAAEKAGVKLPALPKELDFESVDVSPAFTLQLEINVEKANKLLTQMQVDQQFDEKLSGKRFSLQVPSSKNIWLRTGENSLNYLVVDAPELKAPEGVDLEQLRNTMLALPFIPDNVKKQMLSIKDWQHTLPMPYMTDKNSKMKDVKVNGGDAVLITNEHSSQIIWQQDGHIHMLESYDKINGDELLAIAKKL
ncbi:zf-HC2 domain-containing protein [Brevibacillus choshinensis]|uniref:Anti-sigma-W factor RsiW n=1 Tax=Brevibacillus choshinensis TaxID=54911 RepID=A0ABX7FJG1_BRECH|nr:zf-HC2 domain-containing protein [Brevibacillus choshinensis]QRG66272.1 zf-HC2 domain-containing protein [Brevibacillus choshinensis]